MALTRRQFLDITAAGLGGLWLAEPAGAATQTSSSAVGALYRGFRDADRKYSARPFWFWNGKLDVDEIARQIRQMIDHGIYGAYVHNRDGLATRYLSDEWWDAVGGALKAAREAGFSLCFVDEFEWPAGDARDQWLPGPHKSRVLAGNPEYQMKRLRPVETTVAGPNRVEIPLPEDAALVVAGKRIGSDRLDGSTLRTLAFEPGSKVLIWDAPSGEWLVTTYILEPTHDGAGFVDLLNRDAIRKFIDIYYEEFYRRHGEHFGAAFPAVFSDHEGLFGRPLMWTPRLFETFRRLKGYDLEPLLPALLRDIGKTSEKLRCDYLDVISDLYINSFFRQINDWCAAHKIAYTAHMWEESLFFGPGFQGDYYGMLRYAANPSCDSIAEWGRQSTWLKEIASIADFEGRHVVCENQGEQGRESYISPERLRIITNSLGAWNVGEFIPHAFNYDLQRTNFPPDWFLGQPFMPWFKPYADLMRRVSFMNCNSDHVADLLLFYPQTSVFAQSKTVFASAQSGMMSVLTNSAWSEDAVLTNSQFGYLKMRLNEELLDYKVADDSYLAESRIEGNKLGIAKSRFSTLVIPPMSTIRRGSARKVAEFFRAGGTVIAMGQLPLISQEAGRDDPMLKGLWAATFDTAATSNRFSLRTNAAGGRAYLVRARAGEVVDLLRALLDHDVDVVSGPADHLHFLHKKKDGLDFYWIVNDSFSPRTNVLRFRALGKPERWDAASGRRAPVFYQTDANHTLVRMSFGPSDAQYLVFDPAGPVQPLALKATNLDEFTIERASAAEVVVRGRALPGKEPAMIELAGTGGVYRGTHRPRTAQPMDIDGDWTVSVEAPVIPIPYADVLDDPDNLGQRERWFAAEGGERGWGRLWLSPMNCSIRQWNIIGPFENPADDLETAFPPEREINMQAAYEGAGGREIRWVSIDNDADRIEVTDVGIRWALLDPDHPRYGARSNVIWYAKALRPANAEGAIYAQTNIYSPAAQDATVVFATANPTAVYFNGERVHSSWVRPVYHLLHDGFAYRIPVRLKPGSNNLLLKFALKTGHSGRGGASFTCRVEHPDGRQLPGVVAAPRMAATAKPAPEPGFRWLRISVVPLARALRLPAFNANWLAFVDGKPVAAAQVIELPAGTRNVVLRVDANEALAGPFEFVPKRAQMPLGSWTIPGLQHFSGTMVYEKTVDVPAAFVAERVLLDCGQVGVCAEAWVNGAHAGAQPWPPYIFDITGHLRPGRNLLRIRIANTEANSRAVGPSLPVLKNIDLNGWLGPARLIPFFEGEIRCEKV